MTEFPQDRPIKTRKLYCLGGVGTSVKFNVHNNSLANLRRGLIERVFFVENDKKELEPAPKPLSGAFDRLTWFRRKLHNIVGTHSCISPGQFLDFYTGRRRTIYEGAVKSLEGLSVQRRDAYLKTFVKAEKINTTKKPDPAPRVIQPRNVRYNVEVGRYLRRFEHYLYRGIDEIWNGPTIIKGYTVEWQLVNKGVGYASDGMIKYKVDGCRMSGDMNTAMGNCLIACAITHDFFRSRGIRARLMNNGDDCVVICEKECAAVVKADMVRHWRQFGFQCELECDAEIFEQIEFCQMRPVYDGEKYVMVRNPLVSLSKDSYSVGPWNGINHARKWVNAVGLCGLSLTGGIPVVQSYYNMMIRNTQSVNSSGILRDVSFASGFRELARLGNRKSGAISEDARFSFYLAFGITPDLQRAMESDYDAHTIEWGFVPQGNPRIQPISWTLNEL